MAGNTNQDRDLAIGRHAVMAEAFELLAHHLGPFIDERMAEYFHAEPSWAEAAANRLGRPAEHGATDPLFQLLVLRRFWGPVFANFYGQDLRQIIGQLIETRNKWAHFSFPDDPHILQRSVLAIERLVAPVEPGITGLLRRLRSQVYDPDGDLDGAHGESAASPADSVPAATAFPVAGENVSPDPGPSGGAPETLNEAQGPDGDPGRRVAGRTGRDRVTRRPSRRRDEVDVRTLEAQLAETELVFRELQFRYGDLKTELDASRRITASKQLKLTAVEQRLVEAEDHSTAIQEDLLEERITRQHIEWLIVALLATLLLFMVLAST